MTIKTDNLISMINSNKNKKINARKIIETNPVNLPVASKLLADTRLRTNIESDQIRLNRQLLEQIHGRITSVKTNNKNIMQLFPDIELSVQILVSSILSPKTMTEVVLNYKLEDTLKVNPDLTADLMEEISSYIEKTYELEHNLPDILREALFDSGASVYGIIPESTVDEVINTDILTSYGMESYKNKIDNILTSVMSPRNLIETKERKGTLKGKITAESLAEYLINEDLVYLTDNTGILSYARVKEKISSSIIRKSISKNSSISLEDNNKLKYLDLFRKRSNYNSKEVQFLKSRDETYRKSLGTPLVVKFPTESVIPVFSPGNEKNHLGYFLLLDDSGKPLQFNLNQSDFDRLNDKLHSSTKELSPVQKAYKNLISNSLECVNLNELFETYKTVIEKQLFASVKSALYGNNVEVANKNDIYYHMFSRALMEQRTSILFIPKEQIVYYAFNYNEIGIGKSLLENLAVQSSLRAILLFAKVMAYAKQSIDVTKVNISLDPDDPDPEKTIEQVQESVLRLRQNFIPLGINNPVDLVNWIQKAGLQFSYENNPRLPDIKIDFDNASLAHTVPDSELDEELRKQSIIALGLPPEVVDSTFSPDFARSVINNNILLSKRVLIYQNTLEKLISKHVGLFIYTDQNLRSKLKTILLDKRGLIEPCLNEDEKQLLTEDEDKFFNYYLDLLSENIYVSLPSPESTNLGNLGEEFDVYKTNLEKVVGSVISSELFSEDVSGEMNMHIDTIKNIYTNHLLRKWMADNNYMTEVLDITSSDREEVNDLIQVMGTHIVAGLRNSNKLLLNLKEFKRASNQDLNRSVAEGEEGGSSTAPTSSSSTDDSSEEDKEGKDDEFSLDF